MWMKTYDDVIGFDYTSTEEWEDFVKRQILPLHKSISKIIKLREDIEQLLGNNHSDLIRDDTSIRQMLLGGVDTNGEYKPNSLAKIYKETLGISINPKVWVSLCRQSNIDAPEYIRCSFSDTIFLQFIRIVKEITDKFLYLVEVNSPEIDEDEIREILENPEMIMDDLAIYTHLINISANHSYHTFFTLNTRCIPRYYIEQAYPKLKDKFEELVEFLSLEPKFIPDVKDEEIIKNYSLWGHKEDGFADLVYELNGVMYNYFKKEELINSIKLISTVDDLKQEFVEKMDRELNRVGWSFPDYINPSKWGGSNKPKWHRAYEIKGVWLSKCYEVPSWANHSEREVEFDCKSLMELFNDISPALLLGIMDYGDEKIGEYTLRIERNRLRIMKSRD